MEENNTMEEISLREFIEILIKRKRMIAIITIVFLLISTVYSFIILKPKYEVKMILMTSNLANQSQAIRSGEVGKVDDLLNAMSQYPDMNLETYRQQIKAPEVLKKTIEDLGLEDEYRPSTLADSITLETVNETQLITIKMKHTNSEKAAFIVNTLGKNFISFVTEKAQERLAKNSEYVKTQMDVEKIKYEESLLELKDILSQPRSAKEVELELDSSFKQITDFKSALNELEVKRDGLLKAMEEGKNFSNNRGSMIVKPNLGENFNISFDDSNKVMKIDLAETEGRMSSIKEQIENLQKNIEKLQVEYQDKQYKEKIIQQKVDISQKTYESFVGKYEELKVSETAKLGELSINIISSAYPTTRPIGPGKVLNIAISSVLGLMVGVFISFFAEYWQTTSSETKHIARKSIIE